MREKKCWGTFGRSLSRRLLLLLRTMNIPISYRYSTTTRMLCWRRAKSAREKRKKAQNHPRTERQPRMFEYKWNKHNREAVRFHLDSSRLLLVSIRESSSLCNAWKFSPTLLFAPILTLDIRRRAEWVSSVHIDDGKIIFLKERVWVCVLRAIEASYKINIERFENFQFSVFLLFDFTTFPYHYFICCGGGGGEHEIFWPSAAAAKKTV